MIKAKRPVDIEVWTGEAQNGEFPGLHWDEVKQAPNGDWMPFRQGRWTYGPYTCLADVVKAVEAHKEDSYLRYIILGGDQIVFGPEHTPKGEVVH
jgi:hypothetical protein